MNGPDEKRLADELEETVSPETPIDLEQPQEPGDADGQPV